MRTTKARSSKGSSSWAIQLGQISRGDGLTDLTGPTGGLKVQSVQSVQLGHVSRTYGPTEIPMPSGESTLWPSLDNQIPPPHKLNTTARQSRSA